MIITIKIPKWFHKPIKKKLYETIKSICDLLSDDQIEVSNDSKN